jgi:hypothetical protein
MLRAMAGEKVAVPHELRLAFPEQFGDAE